MTASPYRYEGLQLTPRGVWVHFRARVGTTVRHAEILVPWSEFTGDEFLNQLDRQVARSIMEAWSGLNIDQPLY